ncbi:MAG: nuclear transport factor 2 family protein [Emcibacter sp.]|nr:nuclear transport factor 2 family protein [Emcibacter sp.]MBL4893291.1 nuclear transport factor 2 family protein [Emcibacter sp.]
MPNDISKIRSLVDLYGFAVDTRRWALFDKVFSPNMHIDYGGDALWTDLEKFKEDFEAFHRIFDATHHSMANFIPDIKGDTATTVTYGHWLIVRKGIEGGDIWRGNGWYDDEWIRGPEGWRITRRRVRIIHWEGSTAIISPDGFQVPMEVTSLYHAAQAGEIPLLASLNIA